MSVKSKRKERRKKMFAKSEKAAPESGRGAEEEPYTLNAILADFRANKDLEQAAEGIKPVKDEDFEDLFDISAPETAETPFDSFQAEVEETPFDRPAPEIPETPFDASAPEVAETPSALQTAETAFDTLMAETAEALSDASAPGGVTESAAPETPFSFPEAASVDAPLSESAAETPFDRPAPEIPETPFDASASEIMKTPSALETAEAAFDAFMAGTADTAFDASALEGAETPSALKTAETLFDASAPDGVTESAAPETPLDLSEAARILDDAPSENAPDLSHTQTFPTAAHEPKPDAPTFRRGFFGRAQKRKDVKETPEDAAPRSVSLEEIVGNTVDAVKADAIRDGHSVRRSLFSRRRLDEVEDEASAQRPEIIGPEPALKIAAEQARREYVRRIDGLIPAILPAVLPTLALLLEALGVRFPVLTEGVIARPLCLLACLGATLWFCRSVFTDHPCSSTFLCGVSAIAAALDCLTMPFLSARSMAEPYGAVACLALLSAKVGSSLESHGAYDAFHAAGFDRNPPYLVAETVNGARKQRGGVTGFYTSTLAQNFSNRWQTRFLPVTLAASLAFAALSSIGQERGSDFFLNWSAILAAGATLVLPLCWGLPWARLAARLKKAGCAIAGWRGAEELARKKKMVVTDSDLFPPGAVRLEDVRVYEEEMPAIASIMGSMIRESGCGLERVFDDLLHSEGGDYLPVRDFHFYEDGGFSGTIQEDKILLGTSSFLRKMSVRFPGDFYFPMGLYLSVNGALAATFALKYDAPENVDYALRLMRRHRVTAILAARDPNLTPKLLQRVFRRKINLEYPGLNNRIALSAMRTDGEIPRGLLFREGLPPYAETVTGSLRLCAGVRRATLLSLFGSGAGSLLAFYLVYQAKYYLFSPLNLLLFLLLWTAPAVLLMDLS